MSYKKIGIKRAAKLAKQHAKYIRDLLSAHGEEDEKIELIIFHYQSAFVHGWKHGVEHYRHKLVVFNQTHHNFDSAVSHSKQI